MEDSYFQKFDRFKVLNGVRVKKKGCLWAMKPEKTKKINLEFLKFLKKDPQRKEIKKTMAMPDCLPALESGEMKKDYNVIFDSEDEEDSNNPTEKTILQHLIFL